MTLYNAINQVVVSFVPSDADSILDIGCGTGVTGAYLSQHKKRHLVGITYSPEEAALASSRLSEVFCADVNNFDFANIGTFDCVILSHVLEHLYSPSDVLKRLRPVLTEQSIVIIALPNVLWWRQRLQFLMGRWRYEDSGILDRTHFRFFDVPSSKQLVLDAGFSVLSTTYDGRFPVLKPFRWLLGSLANRLDRWAAHILPGLLAYQIVYVARLNDI